MASLYRVRTVLSGFPGGPGVSTMYFLDMQTAIASTRAFWASLQSAIPENVTVQVQNTGDIIESTNGFLTGSWVKEAVLPVQGTFVGIYAAPVGAVVTWLTDTVVDRRRLRGRTFVVPMAGNSFQSNGTIGEVTLGSLRASGQAMVFEQSLSLAIWHRPVIARAATPTSPAIAARAGSHALVTAARVTDKAAVLRSRRD